MSARRRSLGQWPEPAPLTDEEQREQDRLGGIRRAQGRLRELVNGWMQLRSLPDHAYRDEILAGLIPEDRALVLEAEAALIARPADDALGGLADDVEAAIDSLVRVREALRARAGAR